MVKKMTDMEAFHLGLKEQHETWWGKKINANRDKVREGKYGKVLSETIGSSGWFDAVDIPYFVVERNGKKVKLMVDESGIFEEARCGGWVGIDELPNAQRKLNKVV
jgi:hypothetical protein